MEDESSKKDEGKRLTPSFSDGDDHDNDSKVKLNENEVNTKSTSEGHAEEHVSSPSPDSECAICLRTLDDKSFADGCFHSFCFVCLLEWSKVKPKCPLCKQPFKNILHNVRSMEDYDQYHISSKRPDTSPRKAHRHSSSSERSTDRHRYMTLQYSRRYRTRHSADSKSTSEHSHTSSSIRDIYRRRLFVKPVRAGIAQKYRVTTPEFYRQNLACTHRLASWVHRELLVLLHCNENRVKAVLELVLQLITCYDIRSEEFYAHVEPHLQHRTSHFIHEFFNYASSVHDMSSYDNCAVYQKLNPASRNSANLVSSTSRDLIPIAKPSVTISGRSVSLRQIEDLGSSNLRKRGRSGLLCRTNGEGNVRHSALPTSPRSLSCVPYGGSSKHATSSSLCEFMGVVSGPSTSVLQRTDAAHSKTATARCHPLKNETPGSSSGSDYDDCVVVDIIETSPLCSPELLDLASSDEDQ